MRPNEPFQKIDQPGLRNKILQRFTVKEDVAIKRHVAFVETTDAISSLSRFDFFYEAVHLVLREKTSHDNVA